ncbi:MAG: hypothetical protein A3H97_15830 [Acidobacteria bacterium RIFCSPLOWO2_02_FULL_65_29]|nr:MAG: hypothetical protein A3H97_15830 [Acidobacteria bacterium RIFCSPLOWO2_02_FULL_65_29]
MHRRPEWRSYFRTGPYLLGTRALSSSNAEAKVSYHGLALGHTDAFCHFFFEGQMSRRGSRMPSLRAMMMPWVHPASGAMLSFTE